MKKKLNPAIKAAILLVFAMLLFTSCDDSNDASSTYVLDRDTSYAMGMLLADMMKNQFGIPYLAYDYNAFRDGYRAYNEESETRLTWDQAMDRINLLFMRIDTLENENFYLEGERNLEEGLVYLAENGRRPEVTTTASGLQYEVLNEGFGDRPQLEDTVLVYYEGVFIDGTLFDSSYLRNEPTQINLSFVIPGWSEGVQLMNVGSTYRFVIPSHLAYGQGIPGEFPANATLIFTVELLGINIDLP